MRKSLDDAAHMGTIAMATRVALLLMVIINVNGVPEPQPQPQLQRQRSQSQYVESGGYSQRHQLQTQAQRYPNYGESVVGSNEDDGGGFIGSRRRGYRPFYAAESDGPNVDTDLDDNDASYQSFAQNKRQRQQQRLQQQRLHRKQQLAKGQIRPGGSATEANKCRIWVPVETVDKYPYASRIQPDHRNQLQLIEICCAGYGPIRWRGSTVCKPLCENCRNGFCVAPDECQCYEEFIANDNGDCVFTCPLGCLNGRCFLDGTCQCEPGYKLDETRKFCRPICSSGCGMNPRHNCTEPEVCGCAKGYQLTDEGCQPTCDPDCGVGGECQEPNQCNCASGYTLKDNVCQRDCYQKCDNGICYSNNRCICNPGFTYHERSTQCVPK